MRRDASILIIAAVALLHSVATAPSARADSDTAAPCRLGAPGCFLDRDGRVRDAGEAYRALHRRPAPAYGRAAVEMLMLLGAGTAWYWIDRERNVADWDFPSIKQRFTFEAVRYDNNGFGINFLAHPLDGAAAQALARANHLSLAESFGYNLATSLLWEYGLEFREKVSINDMVVTPSAGVAIGEFMHRLAQYVNSAPGGGRGWRRAVAWTFGPTVAAHDRLDGRHTATPGATSGGFTQDIWHRMRLSYGWANAEVGGDRPGPIHALRFDGRLVAIPGYLRPGWFGRPFFDADITSLHLGAGFGGGGHGLALLADAVLLGVHWQRISAAGTGASVVLGSSVAYRYQDASHGPWRDRVGIAHLPGLAADVHLLAGSVTLALRTRLHGDFAGLHAAPYARWEEANPDAVPKTILRKQGYFYGWGWSGRLGASLATPHLAIGGEIFHGRYDSQEGLDRAQERVTHDIEAAGSVLDYEVWLRLHPATSGLYAEVAASSQRRRARVDSFRESARMDRYELRLGAAF